MLIVPNMMSDKRDSSRLLLPTREVLLRDSGAKATEIVCGGSKKQQGVRVLSLGSYVCEGREGLQSMEWEIRYIWQMALGSRRTRLN